MNIQEILNRNRITSIWHFTDRSNLESIAQNGLLSLSSIIEQGVDVSRYGASASSHSQDKRKGLDKFVHLSFVKDHPMYHIAKWDGRIVDPIWIEIDTSILNDDNTLFSNMLANTYNATIFQSEDLERMIDFEKILYKNHSYARKEARKAEIMVSNQINIEQFKGVHNGY